MRTVALAVVAAIGSGPSSARAELVIEAYTDQRPADADTILVPLRELVAKFGVTARPKDIAQRYGDRLPMPGSGLDPDVTAKRISDNLKLGYTAFSKGRFAEAIEKLEQGLAWARRNPALLVGFDNATDVFTNSYAALGMSYLKRNPKPTDEDTKLAHAAWAEQIRNFPAVPMPRDNFGPEGDDLANATRKDLAPLGTGRLIVDVNRGDAQIYIGPMGAGRGGTFTASVVPGEYVIYVEWHGVGRRYVARVVAGRETRLSIDWESASRFVVDKDWVGFIVPSAQRDKLDNDVTMLVRQHVRNDSVVVLGFEQSRGRRFLTASLFVSPVGEKHESVRVELGGAREGERMQALVAWISKHERSADLEEAPDIVDQHPNGNATHSAPRRPIPALSYLSAGLALSAAATGVYLVHLAGRGTCPAGTADDCPQVYKTAPAGWSLVGASVGLAGLAVYWYFHDRGTDRVPAVGIDVSRHGGAIALGWSL